MPTARRWVPNGRVSMDTAPTLSVVTAGTLEVRSAILVSVNTIPVISPVERPKEYANLTIIIGSDNSEFSPFYEDYVSLFQLQTVSMFPNKTQYITISLG